MKTILFQGDSITDAGRSRDFDKYMGFGYATMTAGKIGADYPGKYLCLNRGISGNRSTDLYARIKSDTINLKPDILTILIGVNDVLHEFYHQNGVCAEKYGRILEMYIAEVKEALPDIKIFILEPFILCESMTKDMYPSAEGEMAERAQICKQVADKFDIPFIPLQRIISAFAAQTTNATVLHDGVHPTAVGHELISRELYNALKSVL